MTRAVGCNGWWGSARRRSRSHPPHPPSRPPHHSEPVAVERLRIHVRRHHPCRHLLAGGLLGGAEGAAGLPVLWRRDPALLRIGTTRRQTRPSPSSAEREVGPAPGKGPTRPDSCALRDRECHGMCLRRTKTTIGADVCPPCSPSLKARHPTSPNPGETALVDPPHEPFSHPQLLQKSPRRVPDGLCIAVIQLWISLYQRGPRGGPPRRMTALFPTVPRTLCL